MRRTHCKCRQFTYLRSCGCFLHLDAVAEKIMQADRPAQWQMPRTVAACRQCHLVGSLQAESVENPTDIGLAVFWQYAKMVALLIFNIRRQCNFDMASASIAVCGLEFTIFGNGCVRGFVRSSERRLAQPSDKLKAQRASFLISVFIKLKSECFDGVRPHAFFHSSSCPSKSPLTSPSPRPENRVAPFSASCSSMNLGTY